MGIAGRAGGGVFGKTHVSRKACAGRRSEDARFSLIYVKREASLYFDYLFRMITITIIIRVVERSRTAGDGGPKAGL